MTDLTKLTDAELLRTLQSRVQEARANMPQHGNLNDPFKVKETLGEVWDRVSQNNARRGFPFYTIIETMAAMNAEERENARHIALALDEAFNPNPWKQVQHGKRVTGVTYPAKRSIRNP